MTGHEKHDVAIVTDLADDLRDTVKEIEGSPEMTQGHYGRYMSVISMLADGNVRMGRIIARALIEAGANRQGVQSALRVSF